MIDLSLQLPIVSHGIVVCVELKPKWLCASPCLDSVCYFCAKNHASSLFCPLKLLDSVHSRSTLENLIGSPCKNLKLFVNGFPFPVNQVKKDFLLFVLLKVVEHLQPLLQKIARLQSFLDPFGCLHFEQFVSLSDPCLDKMFNSKSFVDYIDVDFILSNYLNTDFDHSTLSLVVQISHLCLAMSLRDLSTFTCFYVDNEMENICGFDFVTSIADVDLKCPCRLQKWISEIKLFQKFSLPNTECLLSQKFE
ncbi:hypothetical protein RCL1_000369 [Eukaryota sp. TZLM3-RCL]